MCTAGKKPYSVIGYQLSGAYHPGPNGHCNTGANCYHRSDSYRGTGAHRHAGPNADRDTGADCNTGPNADRGTEADRNAGSDSYTDSEADRNAGSDKKADSYAGNLCSKRHYQRPSEILGIFLRDCRCRDR